MPAVRLDDSGSRTDLDTARSVVLAPAVVGTTKQARPVLDSPPHDSTKGTCRATRVNGEMCGRVLTVPWQIERRRCLRHSGS